MSKEKCGFACRTYYETQVVIGTDEQSASFGRFVTVEMADDVNINGTQDMNWFPDHEKRILAGAVIRDMLEHCAGPDGPNCGAFQDKPISEGLPDYLVAIIPEDWTPPEA